VNHDFIALSNMTAWSVGKEIRGGGGVGLHVGVWLPREEFD
jgi:hypothetical protein